MKTFSIKRCALSSSIFILFLFVSSLFVWNQQPVGLRRSKYWVEQLFEFGLESSLDYHNGKNFCAPLSSRELDLYKKCRLSAQRNKKMKKFGPIVEGHCCFMNGTGRKIVGLGSFPGSGNTWLRGLLEKATGICSGAPYCDVGLRTKGFNGEGVVGPSVVVVKSHSVRPKFMLTISERHQRELNTFNAGLLLVRNPRRAFIAEWHRRKTKKLVNATVSSHFLSTGKQYFGSNPDWDQFVYESCIRWKQHVCGWALNGAKYPLHIIAYEDLQSSTTDEIITIMRFFRQINNPLPFKRSEVKVGFNKFHRKHSSVDFNHFTDEQELLIQQTIAEIISSLKLLYKPNSKLMKCLQSYRYNQ